MYIRNCVALYTQVSACMHAQFTHYRDNIHYYDSLVVRHVVDLPSEQ